MWDVRRSPQRPDFTPPSAVLLLSSPLVTGLLVALKALSLAMSPGRQEEKGLNGKGISETLFPPILRPNCLARVPVLA